MRELNFLDKVLIKKKKKGITHLIYIVRDCNILRNMQHKCAYLYECLEKT